MVRYMNRWIDKCAIPSDVLCLQCISVLRVSQNLLEPHWAASARGGQTPRREALRVRGVRPPGLQSKRPADAHQSRSQVFLCWAWQRPASPPRCTECSLKVDRCCFKTAEPVNQREMSELSLFISKVNKHNYLVTAVLISVPLLLLVLITIFSLITFLFIIIYNIVK